MKKLSKAFLGIALVVILLFNLAACGSKESKIVGRWESTDRTNDYSYIEFFSDGTYVTDWANYNGTYSIDGDRLRLSGVLVSDRVYTFEISGKTLTLDSDVYEKY